MINKLFLMFSHYIINQIIAIYIIYMNIHNKDYHFLSIPKDYQVPWLIVKLTMNL